MKQRISFLKNILSHLANHFIWYLGAFVLLALIATALLRVLTPQDLKVEEQSFVTTNYDEKSSTFKKVAFTGEAISLPEKMPLYQMTGGNQVSEDIAEKIRQSFQLTQNKDKDNYWQSADKLLIYQKLEKRFTLYDYAAKIQDSTTTINSDQAIQACQDFFKNASGLTVQAQLDHIIYYNAAEEFKEVSPEKAYRAYIPLSISLNGYPTYIGNKSEFPFSCLVLNNAEIAKVNFSDFFYTFQESYQVKTITIDQAVKNIEKGIASIISIDDEMITSFDSYWIDSARLTKVQVVYRYDKDLQIAYPFYQFNAVLTNSEGLTTAGTIITPAVLSTSSGK